MDSLSALIRRVMDDRDWTVSTVARRSGIPVSTVHSWVTGVRAKGSRGPSPDNLRKLAAGLGLPVATVFEAAGRRVPGAVDAKSERRVVHLYRELTEDQQAVILATMEAMKGRGRAKSDA